MAMETMGISLEDQATVFQLVAGILHLGNVCFVEDGNYAKPENDECKQINWRFITFGILTILLPS